MCHTCEPLKPGERSVPVNNRDPKARNRRFEAEHTGQFPCDYLQHGPQVPPVPI